MSDLPYAAVRFESQGRSNGLPGSLQRAVVVVNGQDVAELPVADVSYAQEAAQLGRWNLMIFADSDEPLTQTWVPRQ